MRRRLPRSRATPNIRRGYTARWFALCSWPPAVALVSSLAWWIGMSRAVACALVPLALLVLPAMSSAQSAGAEHEAGGEHAAIHLGPFSRAAVRDAPFSATASTVIVETKRDGSRVRRESTTHVYRDSGGRVRVEYQSPARTIAMLMLDEGGDARGHRPVYILDSTTRTFRSTDGALAAALFNAETQFAIPDGLTTNGAPRFAMFVTADVHDPALANRESLERRRIEGLDAIGWRVDDAPPLVCRGCEGLPGTQMEERWESPDLAVVVFARHVDRGPSSYPDYPGKGTTIEYRLTDIVREEPPSGLFTVPPDYRQHWGAPSDPDIAFAH